ncbi:MAG: tetratricopeptide repeat protein [Candidatus Eisenbacteria sp.]|nr:tetratricopeptide repeat protein [Candidatus Eisenbacteria bacterium]
MVRSPIFEWVEGVQRRAQEERRLGYALIEKEDFAGAELAFRGALDLDPCAMDCWFGLGVALRMIHRPQDAIQALEQAMANDPQDPEILRHLGLAHREAGHPREALDYLVQSMEGNGPSATALTEVADLQMQLGEYIQAASTCTELYSATRCEDFKRLYHRALQLALQESTGRIAADPIEIRETDRTVEPSSQTPGEDAGKGSRPSFLANATDVPNLFGQTAFPNFPEKPSWTENLARKLGFWGPIRCPVCGRITLMQGIGENVRETCFCRSCGSNNRKRQIGYVVSATVDAAVEKKIRSIRDLCNLEDFAIYNTEAKGAIHEFLKGMPGYVCSEYFGPQHKSGELVNGIMNQDLTDLSFDDESIDLILSSDVFEHIPHPYKGHAEIYRVLKRGGRHVFTVPFSTVAHLDQEIARLDAAGNPVFFDKAMYHGDPVRDGGIPVFRIFGLEMIVNMAWLGFRTHYYILDRMSHGIFGQNLGCASVVFDAVKI